MKIFILCLALMFVASTGFAKPAPSFSVMFTVCQNLIADGKTLDVTTGSSYSMSCIESKNKKTYRCNVRYNNNTSIETSFIKNVDPSGRIYFGAKDGSENYQIFPQQHTAMSVVRISTTTLLGSRVCSGDFLTEEETKKYIKDLKEKAKGAETNPVKSRDSAEKPEGNPPVNLDEDRSNLKN